MARRYVHPDLLAVIEQVKKSPTPDGLRLIELLLPAVDIASPHYADLEALYLAIKRGEQQ